MKAIICVFGLCAGGAAAETVRFDGSIGPYGIEVELADEEAVLAGRYRYDGRDSWISLSGETFGQSAIRLEETVDGAVTGTFFLETGQGNLEGYWAGAGTDYAVQLEPISGELGALFKDEPVEELSASLTGRYEVGYHWVNDWFAPNYEIGFNGGEANVVQLAPNVILVGFNFIVGPTYHFAGFQGLAALTSDGSFVHDAALSGGDEPCRLVFSFENGGLSIEDIDNGFACQFGARAHANFDLQKVSNTAEFSDGW